jgi:acetylornithine deacetylase
VKGALSCFLAAVAALEDNALALGCALILTADEEIGCKGMERLLREKTLRIQSAIISEPTSLRPGIAGKGYGLARITIEGKEAHSAFPERGVSAIAVAAQLIVRIQDRFAGGWETASQDALFDPPRTTVNIGVIEGGTAKNIIAGHCMFLVEWRALPGESPEYFLGELRSLLEEARQAEPRAAILLEALRAEAGFAPTTDGPLMRRLAEVLPGPPIGICFGSEASRVARIAEEVIVMGPGDMQTAHSDRECVPAAELQQWTEALRRLLTA